MFFYENKLFGDKNSYDANILEDFEFNMHFHRSCEIMYIAEGNMCITVDNNELNVSKGDMVFVFSNQLHSLKTIGHSVLKLIIYSPELVGRFMSEYNNLIPENPVIRNVDFDMDEFFTDNLYLQKSALYKALGMLSEKTGFKKAAITGDFKLIHRILTFIEDHYNEECTLKHVSAILKYDYAYLSKQFVKTMNMSYTEYLNRYRVNQACYLMSNRSIPIGEVYFECGFDSARSFNRNFKRYTGMTPSEFRNKIRLLNKKNGKKTSVKSKD